MYDNELRSFSTFELIEGVWLYLGMVKAIMNLESFSKFEPIKGVWLYLGMVVLHTTNLKAKGTIEGPNLSILEGLLYIRGLKANFINSS